MSASYVGEEYHDGPSVEGNGPGTLTLSKQVTVSNTWSADVTVKQDDVTAKVGFSVTNSQAVTAGSSINMPDSKRYTLFSNEVFDRYEFDINRFDLCGTNKGRVGRGSALNFSHMYYGSYSN